MDPGRKSISVLTLVEVEDAKDKSQDIYFDIEKKEQEHEILTPESEKDMKENLYEERQLYISVSFKIIFFIRRKKKTVHFDEFKSYTFIRRKKKTVRSSKLKFIYIDFI